MKEAEAIASSERFGNEASLAKLAANWPAARQAEIWNSQQICGALAIILNSNCTLQSRQQMTSVSALVAREQR